MLVLIPTLFEAKILFGESITAPAAGQMVDQILTRCTLGSDEIYLGICGFGMAAAGVGAAQAIGCYQQRVGVPKRICLLGIAGSYDLEKLPLGAAFVSSRVHCWGIGVGTGQQFFTAESLGWSQRRKIVPTVGQESATGIALDVSSARSSIIQAEIISVTAASNNFNDASMRRGDRDTILAEDMETFSVALAADLYEIPLTVIRGVSNQAGDRNKDRWVIEPALRACRDELEFLIKL